MSTAAARVVRVLELLAHAGRPLSVTEIGLRLGTGKSTVSRLLRDLARHALLEREDERGRFRLGIRLAEFSRAALEGTDLRVASASHLRALSNETHESVHLATFRGEQVIYIDKVELPTFVRTSTEIGDVAPPHCTASGKAILAWLPDAALARWLRGRRFVSYTVRTMTTRAAILSHLHKVRVQGYALDDEEYVQDVRCVAAPILNHNGEVVASVGVSSLASRLGRERLPRVVAAVRKTASAISGALGGPRQDLSRAERPVRTGARPPASAAHRAQRRGSAAFSASPRKEDGSR
jgi:IclR family transcriptional regulator, KDG regulon repressor